MRDVIKYILYILSYVFHHNKDSKIIYYHDVSNQYTSRGTDLDTIKRHVEIVKKYGYKIVPQITSPHKQVMVCFDDGWAGLYDAKDYFLAEHISPTVFIAVDLIGKPRYLTLDQILELQSLGFRFEGHTWSHKDLTIFDDIQLEHEIKDSKSELSKLLGKEVEALCFPKGRFSDKVYHCSMDAGYTKLYSSITGGYYDLLNSKNLICRNLVQSVSDFEFKCILNATSRFFVHRSWKIHYQK